MGRSKQSAEECVQNLQRRAVELQQKIGKQTVSEAMRRHPWCVHELLSKLEALGLVAVTESGSRKLVEKSGCHAMPPSLQAQARASRQKQAAPGPSPRKGDEMAPDIAPDDQVPTKYWTLDGLSPHSLASRILSVAEPASLSMPNLKSITVKRQSLQNHQVHVRLVEFMTGLPPDFSLSGVYRSWKALSEFVCERNECRGRRLQGATLPVDFDNMGIYEMIGSEGSPTICIRHRFTNQQVDYQRTSLPHHACIRQLFIDSDWSENRAAISSTADPSRQHDVMLLPRFPIQAIKDPPPPLGHRGRAGA